MSNTKPPAASGTDWTRLLFDPDLIGGFGKLFAVRQARRSFVGRHAGNQESAQSQGRGPSGRGQNHTSSRAGDRYPVGNTAFVA